MSGMDGKRTCALLKRLCLCLDQWRLAVVRGSQQLAAIVALLYPTDQAEKTLLLLCFLQCCGTVGTVTFNLSGTGTVILITDLSGTGNAPYLFTIPGP
jgi:hypothetical protein